MKKSILFCGLAALMAGVTTSCGNSASDTGTNDFEDSLAVYIGTVSGVGVNHEIDNLNEDQRARINKKDVIEGIKTVLLADTSNHGYFIGVHIGLQLNGNLDYLAKANKLDRQKIIAAFEKAFLADSVPNINEINAAGSGLVRRAEEKVLAKIKEDKANSPEAIQNRKTGEAFINNLKKEDASIKTTESGLSYKVIAEGEGETVKEGDVVLVKYVFKLIDGKIAQESGDNPTRLSVAQVIPGFAEGLKMMKKGSKYNLYIPGEIGYGVDGIPQLGVGPNTTLIYEVELIDINPDK